MSRPLVLMYNIGNPKATKIRVLCMKLHIGFKDVLAPAWLQPIGALAGVLPESETPSESPATFADEMLVMAHLSSLQASQFLQSLRRLGVPPIALKAMLTPTNCEWNSLTLHNEISSEHAALEAGKQAVHSAPDTSAES